MRILLTNDDGVYAPGLAALERVLRRLGEVFVVAPLREQSGVAHSITFLTPLLVRKVYVNDKHWAWTVDGSPADCVKLAISAILPEPPDLVVSGINGGLNAGVNVFYSGTVGAAVEGTFYGITSIAVSLQYNEKEPVQQAADIAVGVIDKILKQNDRPGRLYNVNIPLKALDKEVPEVKVVPVDAGQYWDSFEQRTDTLGRAYYWLSGQPNPRQPQSGQPQHGQSQHGQSQSGQPMRELPAHLTDVRALSQGYITVTPLNYDITDKPALGAMADWDLTLSKADTSHDGEHTGPRVRVSWSG